MCDTIATPKFFHSANRDFMRSQGRPRLAVKLLEGKLDRSQLRGCHVGRGREVQAFGRMCSSCGADGREVGGSRRYHGFRTQEPACCRL